MHILKVWSQLLGCHISFVLRPLSTAFEFELGFEPVVALTEPVAGQTVVSYPAPSASLNLVGHL